MMSSESRTCNECDYPVTYHWIWDAHDPAPVTQFTAKIIVGKSRGLYGVMDRCPQCEAVLTLDSTTKVGND
ncbi:MAG: hypothetical protein UX29_C0002G0012 [Parcubacteria group bacterium GW2011_GWA2_46_10]|nr:MAG: hypothetical protein UW86_C0004G0002 [Microgenomates group bacterium GW2011_GWA1_Microgenomates_45_10]KKU19539.1 MAG: hypothetical protein UX29_C0002G0012 [Parcubacteria group bacterium GW2011_GWA2_46_10]